MGFDLHILKRATAVDKAIQVENLILAGLQGDRLDRLVGPLYEDPERPNSDKAPFGRGRSPDP